MDILKIRKKAKALQEELRQKTDRAVVDDERHARGHASNASSRDEGDIDDVTQRDLGGEVQTDLSGDDVSATERGRTKRSSPTVDAPTDETDETSASSTGGASSKNARPSAAKENAPRTSKKNAKNSKEKRRNDNDDERAAPDEFSGDVVMSSTSTSTSSSPRDGEFAAAPARSSRARTRTDSTPASFTGSATAPSVVHVATTVQKTIVEAPSTVTSSVAALRDQDPLGDLLARYDDQSSDDVVDEHVVARTDSHRYLGFELGNEWYAANILAVREIVKMVAVTPVPRSPAGVLGVFSKRGVVMPVIDLGAALGLRSVVSKIEPTQRILVVGEGEEVVGLRVDRVHGVFQFSTGDIGSLPGGIDPAVVPVLHGLARVGRGLYILIDIQLFRETLGNSTTFDDVIPHRAAAT